MSQEILVQDLRRKSRDRIQEMWREAESRAAVIRAEKDKEFEQLNAEEKGRLKEVERTVTAPLILEAEKEALLILDEAMRKLSGRLYSQVLKKLSQARLENYENIFCDLVNELPPFEWETITVNDGDAELALQHFPGVELRTDPDMAGGFVLSGDKGKYQVINTLEHRLEKAWPFVLPVFLKEVVEVKDAANAA